MQRTAAFTLIELLVVMAIILVVVGMIVGLPTGDQRRAAVMSAAEELAATLRTARSYAIDQSVVCGVAFNIQNAPETSGLVLNNWSGGHWYRIIGPDPISRESNSLDRIYTYPIPLFQLVTHEGRGSVADFLSAVNEAWLGDRHVLPQRKVRFLALTDQDSGTGGWASAGRIPATYPRPWYGWYDESSRTLYPWGGYDGSKPAAQRIRDFAATPRYCSGFYYEGNDGTVVGCVNPTDKNTTNTRGGQAIMRFLAQGQPRPLIHGDWLDYVIFFNPDGTAGHSTFYARRHSFSKRAAADTDDYNQGGLGVGDLGAYTAQVSSGDINPTQTFVRHTGCYAITLAADAEQDSDAFPDRNAAFKSLWPAYRVLVSRLGDIRVRPVSPNRPAGLTFDTASIPTWQPASPYTAITTYYKGFIATNPNGSLRTDASGRQYMPVDTFLTPDILASRQWWGLW